MAARQAQRAAGKKPRGKEPVPPSVVPEPKAQSNFTDPESKIMKVGNGQHFEQAYNAQAAVDGAMLIVGARGNDAPNDKQELPATVAVINPGVKAAVKNVLVDRGFYREAAGAAVEKHSHHKTGADLLPQPEPPAPGPEASVEEQMAHRLKLAVGQALYRLSPREVPTRVSAGDPAQEPQRAEGRAGALR